MLKVMCGTIGILKRGFDYHVVIAAEIGQPGKFRGFINEKRVRFLYESEVAAQLGLFDAIEKIKEIAKKRAASLN